MKMSQKRIQSQNKEWGFYQTMRLNYDIEEATMDRIFDQVGHSIAQSLAVSEDQARFFLDSRYGRHFADELSFNGAKAGLTEKDLIDIAERVIEESQWVKLETHNQDEARG